MVLDWGRSLIFFGRILCVGLLVYFLYHNHKKNLGKNIIINSNNDIQQESIILNGGNKTKRGIIAILLFVIGALPLLIYYPFIIGAVAMSLAAIYNSGNGMDPMKMPIILLMFFILAYPITYIICWIYYKKGKKKIIIPLLPLLHIFIVLITLFFLK